MLNKILRRITKGLFEIVSLGVLFLNIHVILAFTKSDYDITPIFPLQNKSLILVTMGLVIFFRVVVTWGNSNIDSESAVFLILGIIVLSPYVGVVALGHFFAEKLFPPPLAKDLKPKGKIRKHNSSRKKAKSTTDKTSPKTSPDRFKDFSLEDANEFIEAMLAGNTADEAEKLQKSKIMKRRAVK